MNPIQNPGWDWNFIGQELLKGAPAAFVALVIGCVAGYVAWRQYQVAKAKLNLDLFNQRYELYLVLWTYLTYVASAEAESQGPRVEMNNALPKSYFLFGEEIGDYFTQQFEHGRTLHSHYRALRAPQTDGSRKAIETKILELESAFTNERLQLRHRFAPFLSFDQWRAAHP